MEIILIEFPKTELREQSGFRPALLLSKPNKDIYFVIPITSNILALRFKNTFKIEPNLENGLTSVSVILNFHLRAIDKNRIIKKIGNLDENIEKKIKINLKNILEI